MRAAAKALPSTNSYRDRIREHVERDEVGAARRVLAEALREGANVGNWAEILAPAKILGFGPPAESDLSTELRWFKEKETSIGGNGLRFSETSFWLTPEPTKSCGPSLTG